MQFPSIDPVFLRIGPLQFRWYGLMYILGFIATYFILRGKAPGSGSPFPGTTLPTWSSMEPWGWCWGDGSVTSCSTTSVFT